MFDSIWSTNTDYNRESYVTTSNSLGYNKNIATNYTIATTAPHSEPPTVDSGNHKHPIFTTPSQIRFLASPGYKLAKYGMLKCCELMMYIANNNFNMSDIDEEIMRSIMNNAGMDYTISSTGTYYSKGRWR